MSLGRTLGDLGYIIGRGLLAGLAGTAAVTVVQAAEMSLTGRAPSTTPAEAVEKVFGIRAIDDDHKAQLAQLVHWGYGTSWGLFRSLLDVFGLRGAEANLVHCAAVWGTAMALLPALEVAPPPHKWPAKMHVTEGVIHLVYAEVAGMLYDVMSERS